MCRGCGQSGDGIQFLRDSVGLSYSDACRALQVAPNATTGRAAPKPQAWTPKPTTTPTNTWQEQAARFVAECAANMAPESEGMDYAKSRGMTPDTVKALRIGWNPVDRWEERQAWGLEPEQNANGNAKKVWLPAGLVVPSHRKAGLIAVKVRRTAWTPEDTLPKYVALPGSVPGLALGCDTEKPVVLVESELDAVLVWQEARNLVGALALGTATGKPDTDTAAYLRTVPRILVALDFDRAGIEAFPWWPAHFPQAEPWPVVQGKDVGDMAGTPGLVRAWIELATVTRQEQAPAPIAALPGQIACLGCGKPFTPSDPNKVYCRAWCFNHVRVVQ